VAKKRNHEEAQKIADKIAKQFHEHPDGQILIVSHSAGTGLCVWALEDLPDDVKVDTVLLLSPALSPDYDLSKALSHVRGKAYAFVSPNDLLVLAAGTRLFGTIDGKKTAAAGNTGFSRPDGADPKQYDKLVSMPYDPAWMKLGNIGDHVGYMMPAFDAAILSPLLLAGLPHRP
jgi:alpha-beta hydrolase superfamily lysophospholipase